MRSGDLLAYSSLNNPSSGIVSFSWCSFAQNLPRNSIFQKFNFRVTDRWTGGPTDGHHLLWRCQNAFKTVHMCYLVFLYPFAVFRWLPRAEIIESKSFHEELWLELGFVAGNATYKSPCRSVGRSVRPSVQLITAPAQPPATGVIVTDVGRNSAVCRVKRTWHLNNDRDARTPRKISVLDWGRQKPEGKEGRRAEKRNTWNGRLSRKAWYVTKWKAVEAERSGRTDEPIGGMGVWIKSVNKCMIRR